MSRPQNGNNESNGLWKQCCFKPLTSSSASWLQICAVTVVLLGLQHLLLSKKKKAGPHCFSLASLILSVSPHSLEGFPSRCESDVFLQSRVLARHDKPDTLPKTCSLFPPKLTGTEGVSHLFQYWSHPSLNERLRIKVKSSTIAHLNPWRWAVLHSHWFSFERDTTLS